MIKLEWMDYNDRCLTLGRWPNELAIVSRLIGDHYYYDEDEEEDQLLKAQVEAQPISLVS